MAAHLTGNEGTGRTSSSLKYKHTDDLAPNSTTPNVNQKMALKIFHSFQVILSVALKCPYHNND
jgi:hypothetical protein